MRGQRNRAALVLFAALAAGLAWAEAKGPPALADLHLPLMPRSEDEAARIAQVVARASDFSKAEQFEAMQGGATTVRRIEGPDAFSLPSANIGLEGEQAFKLGNGLFRRLWVAAPASTLAADGLGPLYNARACQSCHIRDGRGHPPAGPDDDAVSMFLRLSLVGGSVPMGIAEWHATRPDPVYGGQLQDFAAKGLAGEYRLGVSWTEEQVELSGGEVVTLRRPEWRADDLAYGPFGFGAMLSPRVAQPMIGLGLIEAIPAANILALADPDDADGNGISGRAAIVPSVEYDVPMLGRFGWKAGHPTIRSQSADAFAADMGLSSPLMGQPWGDCTQAQEMCRTAPHGDRDARGTEVDAEGLDLVTFYSRNLAPPMRRNADAADVLRGKELFYSAGCTGCHWPKFVTGQMPDNRAQSFQLIWPYSDFLLHDMGEGLADNRPEGRASGREWRTQPLWGIGLTGAVGGVENYLHDGRARSLLEAILWHGGEAQAARDAVVALPSDRRAALIAFLESL